MDILTMGLLALGLIVVIFLLLLLVEKKWSTPKGSDWYDTPTDDDLAPLLGVVAPKKKKGED
jgi:hypothetical protein